MSKQSDKVKKWRKTCKERIVVAMGGKCCICGYNKCHAALALHHLDPSRKDFSFKSVRANPKKWDSIVQELRKCVLLCHNCHSETHAGVAVVPITASRFDESFVTYDRFISEPDTPCALCQKLKSAHLKHCSTLCARRAKRKVRWDTIDLATELKTKSIVALADELGCSDSAIHKRLRLLGLK